MLAICLALGASVAWGISDFIAGTKSRVLPVLSVIAVSQAAGLMWCAFVLLLGDRPVPGKTEIALAVASGLAFLAALACFYKAMAIGKISLVVPITSMCATIPVAVGIMTGDRPGELQVLGMVLALTGVLLTSREPAAENARNVRPAPGVLLAGAAAIASGTFLLATDAASDGDPIWASLLSRAAMLSILLVVVAVVQPSFRDAGRHLFGLAAIGSLDISGQMLFATASTLGMLSVVAVLGSLYSAVAVLLAITLLHERVDPPQWIGIAAVLSGIMLILV